MLNFLFVLQIAHENGYTKLLLGSCTSRMACHVISATVEVRFCCILKNQMNYDLILEFFFSYFWKKPGVDI